MDGPCLALKRTERPNRRDGTRLSDYRRITHGVELGFTGEPIIHHRGLQNPGLHGPRSKGSLPNREAPPASKIDREPVTHLTFIAQGKCLDLRLTDDPKAHVGLISTHHTHDAHCLREVSGS